MKSFIVVDNITYTYPTRADRAVPALAGLSLEIAAGEYVAIVGANGSGKSTLARHFNALLTPDEGSVRVAGQDTRVARYHPEIRRAVGMVFQHPEDQTVATVVEHDVAFGPENLGLPQQEIRARVAEALDIVGLWEERHRPPHMLSAGQMQRLALAGVLAMRPDCIVFDEATAMLDPVGRRTVRQLMRRLHKEGLTIIAITHLMNEAADADRVVVLSKGRVALDGSPRDVFEDADRLYALKLDVPLPTAIAEAIRKSAPTLPRSVLSVPELIAALERLPHRCEASEERHETQGNDRSAIITTTDLGHVYMQGTPFAQRALQDVDFKVIESGVHGLVGATGSGKSTLLQHLNGLLRPQEGAVQVGPYDLGSSDVDLRAVRRMVGLVFQRPEAQIFEQYVGDEIAYGPRLAGLDGEPLRERVRWAMELVGLNFEAFKDRLTFALSGGEQRKVALASTLALEPRVLLLDEPTAGLDPGSRRELLAHLQEFQAAGMTLVLSSHQMEDMAVMADQVTVMARGTTVAGASVADIFGQGKRLRDWGLEPPIVSEIAEALHHANWQLAPGIVTESQLVAEVKRCL